MEKLDEGFKGERIIRLPQNVQQLQAANTVCKHLYITDIGYYPQAKYHYYARPAGIIAKSNCPDFQNKLFKFD